MKKVLILDGDAAHAVAIAEALSANGYEVGALCPDKLSYGFHAGIIKHRFFCPVSSHDESAYIDFLTEFLKNNKFDILIPTSDETAMIMSKYRAQLSPLAAVLMPDFDTFMKAYDKNRLMALCEKKGFPLPKTIDLNAVRNLGEEAVTALKEFPYPALIKPNLTSGARGMTRVDSYEEFLDKYPKIREEFGECHLQQFIPPGGRQLKVQAFRSIHDANDGAKVFTTAIWKQRFYPVKGGSSCCNITVSEPKYEEICSRVLQEIGWEGFADFDLIENPATGEFLIMEINPRLPACIRSVFKSGVDYATMIADASLGLPTKDYVYSPGKSLRHLGFDVLWFLKSPERWKAKPSWFKFFGKDLYYQDWVKGNFPAFLFGTIGNIKKILNPEFRKAKRI